jgi:hypothetical protein
MHKAKENPRRAAGGSRSSAARRRAALLCRDAGSPARYRIGPARLHPVSRETDDNGAVGAGAELACRAGHILALRRRAYDNPPPGRGLGVLGRVARHHHHNRPDLEIS